MIEINFFFWIEILPNKTNHILSYQKSTIADLNQLLHKIMCTEGFHETNVLLLFKTIKTQGQNIAKFSRKNRKLCRAHCAKNWINVFFMKYLLGMYSTAQYLQVLWQYCEVLW